MSEYSCKAVFLSTFLGLLLLSAGCQEDDSTESLQAIPSEPIPRAATNLVTRGQMAMTDGNFVQALRAVDEGIRRAPHFTRGYFVRGQILTRMNRLEEAREAFEHVLNTDPSFSQIHFYLGNNAVQRRQFSEALSHFDAEIANLSPETQIRHKLAVWMQKGNVHRELGEAADARTAYEQTLVLNDSLDLAYDAIGQVYREEGELELALAAKLRAYELNPENGNYAYNVGAVLYLLGRPAEAIHYLEESREKLPWFYGSYYNLGRSLIDQGKVSEGEKYLAIAEDLQKQQAELALAKATAEATRTPEAWMAYAKQLHEEERFPEALQAYRAVTALAPSNNVALKAIRDIEIQLGADPKQ